MPRQSTTNYVRSEETRARMAEAKRRGWAEGAQRRTFEKRMERQRLAVYEALPGTITEVMATTGLSYGVVRSNLAVLADQHVLRSVRIPNSRGFGWAKRWEAISIDEMGRHARSVERGVSVASVPSDRGAR